MFGVHEQVMIIVEPCIATSELSYRLSIAGKSAVRKIAKIYTA